MKNIPQAGNQNLYQEVEYDLTAADLMAMYAAPIELVAAVPGKTLLVESVLFVMNRTATAFTGGGVVDVQYTATVNGAGTTTHADIAAAVVTTAGAATTYTFRVDKDLSAIASASIAGAGLYLSNKTAPFAAGTGTAKITVTYRVI